MKKLKLQELLRPDVDTYKSSVDKLPIVIVADNIRSALNIGSLFRTADAFCMDKIVLCGICATPPNREIQKSALGATESVDWYYENNVSVALRKLKSEGYVIVIIEQTDESVMLSDYIWKKDVRYAIVLGNEVYGVSDEALSCADVAIEIPQGGTKHSLNVSVAAGIVMWEVAKGLSNHQD